jgi:hypothetical protein
MRGNERSGPEYYSNRQISIVGRAKFRRRAVNKIKEDLTYGNKCIADLFIQGHPEHHIIVERKRNRERRHMVSAAVINLALSCHRVPQAAKKMQSMLN